MAEALGLKSQSGGADTLGGAEFHCALTTLLSSPSLEIEHNSARLNPHSVRFDKSVTVLLSLLSPQPNLL